MNQSNQTHQIDEIDRIYGLTGYPTDQLRRKNIPPQRFASLAAPPDKGQSRRPRHSLVSPLTFLQLGLRGLAVLYFSEELTHLLAKKGFLRDTQEPFKPNTPNTPDELK